jgi:hypothetical protein
MDLAAKRRQGNPPGRSEVVFMTRDEHQALIDLTWRYAALVGVTDVGDLFDAEVLSSDKKDWGHLIKKSAKGMPMFDDSGA